MRDKMIRDLFPDLPVKAPSGGGGFGFGAMMLCEDDPLRNTPEKAEKYGRFVYALSVRQRATSTAADVAAAMKLLGVPCACVGQPYGHSFGCKLFREAAPFA